MFGTKHPRWLFLFVMALLGVAVAFSTTSCSDWRDNLIKQEAERQAAKEQRIREQNGFFVDDEEGTSGTSGSSNGSTGSGSSSSGTSDNGDSSQTLTTPPNETTTTTNSTTSTTDDTTQDVEQVEAQDNSMESAFEELSMGVSSEQFSGTGDDEVSLTHQNIPLLFEVTSQGTAPFTLTLLGANGEESAVLVDAPAGFSGTITNWGSYNDSAALRVSTTDPWTIQALPMSNITSAQNGQAFDGSDVVLVTSNAISQMDFDYTGSGEFSVQAIGMNSSEWLVPTTSGPYSQTVPWTEPETMLIVQADGPWSVSWS